MAEKDAEIGEAVRLLRGDRTQEDVAATMRERGWKWSQATMWAVEKGTRPLKLAEADALSAVLDVPLWRLLTGEKETSVLRALDRVAEAESDLRHAVFKFHRAQNSLGVEMRDGLSAGEVSEGTRGRAEQRMNVSLDDVVAKGTLIWERTTDPERWETDG